MTATATDIEQTFDQADRDLLAEDLLFPREREGLKELRGIG